jgi:hypothetical protein
LRSGIIQSFFSWSFGIVLIYFILPEYFLKFSLIALAGIFIPFLIILLSTYNEKFKGSFQSLAAISNIIAGLMTIYFCHHFTNGVYIMLPLLILVVFFGYYLYRFRLLTGVFVTVSYIATFQVYLLSYSELEFSQIILLSSIAWLTVAFSISLGYVYEKNHRLTFIQQQTIQQQKLIIEQEKEKSEKLLLNILPFKVAKELKNDGRAQPRRYENVTILFSDFQGFTELVASISPLKLEQELNDIFSNFDDIMEDEGIEKIKTIGDAYLAAGGLPEESPDHAQRCIAAAKRMIDFSESSEYTKSNNLENESRYTFRANRCRGRW